MITLTWYGHSTLGLETELHKLLIDPYFTDNPAASTVADNVSADYILVTHGHNDHLGDTVGIAKRSGAITISNPELCLWLEKQGLDAQNLRFNEPKAYPFGTVELTQAVHGNKLPDGSEAGQPAGFVLTLEGKKIYVAGDTGLFDGMTGIGQQKLDWAILPIGGFYTMDPDQALQAVKVLAPRKVIPYHYNTWDKIKQSPNAWAVRVEKETPTEVQVMKPGERLTL